MDQDIAIAGRDLMVLYNRARQIVGQPQAQDVIRRFGTEYAGMVPPQHYASAIQGLLALLREHETKQNTPDPETVRQGWKTDQT